jgi:hypothetical protein
MKKSIVTMKKRTSGSKEGTGGVSPSQLIDARIEELNDWRGETLARVRSLIKQVDPNVQDVHQVNEVAKKPAASGSPDPLRPSSEEVPLNWNKWVRQIHRWLAIAFTVAVIVNIVALGREEPAVWLGLLALLPLVLLLLTGLYLFVLPHATKWRSALHTGG